MSNHSELKRMAEAALNDNGDYVALSDYGMAVPPAAVLALIAEVEGLRHGWYSDECCNIRFWPEELSESKQEIDRLEAEVEELRKDAERYKWLSAEGNWVARMFGKWRAHVGEYGDSAPTEWYDTRKEAIDAAITKGDRP